MNISAIKKKFHGKAKDQNGLFLLNSIDAVTYIDECDAANIKLVGVEGFLITEKGAFQPDQGASNDIADHSMSQESFIKVTKDLLNKYNNHWFDVVHETTRI